MRYPDTYSTIEIKQWNNLEEYSPGKWAPARPLPFPGFSFEHLFRSFRIAFGVLIGKYDALNWNGDRR